MGYKAFPWLGINFVFSCLTCRGCILERNLGKAFQAAPVLRSLYLDAWRVQHLYEVDGGDADGLWAAGVDHVQQRPRLPRLHEGVPQRRHAPPDLAQDHLLICGLLRGLQMEEFRL